jgi:uncharacterized protein
MSFTSQNVFNLACTMRVLTLATYSNKEIWTAPVYYVFYDKKFYFFSNPDSRHIKEALYLNRLKNRVAASVFSDDTDFKNIKGLQMQGNTVKVDNKKDAVLCAMGYVKKYKIYPNTENILEFFQKEYRAGLYCFIPEIIYYLDNTEKIGSREKIEF